MYTNQTSLYCSQLIQSKKIFFLFDTLTQKEPALKQNYLMFHQLACGLREITECTVFFKIYKTKNCLLLHLLSMSVVCVCVLCVKPVDAFKNHNPSSHDLSCFAFVPMHLRQHSHCQWCQTLHTVLILAFPLKAREHFLLMRKGRGNTVHSFHVCVCVHVMKKMLNEVL